MRHPRLDAIVFPPPKDQKANHPTMNYLHNIFVMKT